MILTIPQFRDWLARYEKFVPSELETWWSFYKPEGLRDKEVIPKVPTPQEDIFVRELIDNVDFYALYSSIEFRKALRKRLKYYEEEKV